jgi:glucose/mannose transport system substrate-binding protein
MSHPNDTRGQWSWQPRRSVLRAVVAALVIAVLVVPAVATSKTSRPAAKAASCQLSVFSWWTGGGEAAGLTKLIGIWNHTNASCPFKNETVAGGAGTNAKAVLAQRLTAHNPPDSFQGHAGKELLDYIKAGQVEPIDFIYQQYGFRSVMPAGLLSQISYKGHIYSVPVNIHRANILWYNPKVLRQAGISGAPKTWGQFLADLKKVQANVPDVTPLALGEQWTQKHLFETVLISKLGPVGWAKLWQPGNAAAWSSPKVKAAIAAFDDLLQNYTNSDAASLTWQDAGKLVLDGKAAFNVMGDWQDGYFSGSLKGGNLHKKPGVDYGWTAVPGTGGVYDWLSDSFTLPKGAPHRDAAVKWLGFLGSKQAQDTFNPVKGSIPARKDANAKLYGPYLKWALTQWKSDKLVGSLTHGVVADNAWNSAIDTALGLFVQTHNAGSFQAALVKAAQKGNS